MALVEYEEDSSSDVAGSPKATENLFEVLLKFEVKQQKIIEELPKLCCESCEDDLCSDSPPRTSDQPADLLGSALWPGCLFDSHCHMELVYRRLAGEGARASSLQESLARDGQAVPQDSMAGVLANCCFPRDWPSPQQLVGRQGDRVFYSLGCHPKQADLLTPDCLARLEQLVRRREVVAMGECGLDYSQRSGVAREVQARAFLAQLALALRYNLPLVLHAREAEDDLYILLRQAAVPHDWPIHRHCFTGDWSSARRWLAAFPASKIGLTNLVTFPQALQVKQVASLIPLSRLLLETDAPYFPPRTRFFMSPTEVSFSQPGHVLQVAAMVALLKGRPLEQVLRANLRNVTEIYGIITQYKASRPST